MPPRRFVLGAVLLIIVALASVATIASGSDTTRTLAATPVRATGAIKVGDLTRTWLEITPRAPETAAEPIVVVLSGVGATLALEVARDDLVPLVSANDVELVYPVGVGRSWNAGGCCGEASRDHIDDVAFLNALVVHLDPQHRRPIYLVGYSNGGRLAYRIACTVPALFNEIAVVKAMPEPGCVVTHPLTFLQLDSSNDPDVPYHPGDLGPERPAATTEVARLRSADGCDLRGSVVTLGSLILKTWQDCSDDARLAFATYEGGQHSWPEGSAVTPSAASVIWSFFSQSRLR